MVGVAAIVAAPSLPAAAPLPGQYVFRIVSNPDGTCAEWRVVPA